MPSQCGGGEALDQGSPGQATSTSPMKTSPMWTSPMWGDVRQGPGVQEWPDGSRYEGEYLNGLRHGPGRFTWRNGEYYEGAFYRDYRHGEGFYSWPSGHKFTGKFYLNKKEGYGMKEFPDGSSFQGLFHAHQKFGPGVLTYADGRQDVGLWSGDHLVRLCTSLEGAFSLSSFPEYAAYMGPPPSPPPPPPPPPPPAAAVDPLTTPSLLSTAAKPLSKGEQDPLGSPCADPLTLEDSLARPPGLECYSSDGDHLPRPPGFRRELDRSFFGELWEPEPDTEPDLVCMRPWRLRMQAHIHRHRLETVRAGWDVSAVLSLSRSPFGPKGPLELSSELLIQRAGEGDRHAVNQILRTRLVSPDVSDARDHTPLIAATVNCHDAVIDLLLDTGADIDHLNCEGMNALAVCHVLYYPFHCLHTTVAERAAPPAQVETLNSAARSPGGDSDTDEQDTDSSSPHDSQQGTEGGGGGGGEEEEAPGQFRCLEVLDGHIPLGTVTWRVGGAREVASAAAGAQRYRDNEDRPLFDSARSLESFVVPVTEDGMQHTAEALSRIGVAHRTRSQETVRRMAAMKTEHRARWSTLSLLLQRGSDPNASRVPMPVLFLAIKAAHVEAVRALLLRGASTDRPLPPEWKGLYPLHIAAGLSGPEGPRITELLLHTITDPDAHAQDQEDVYHLDKTRTEQQTALCNQTLVTPTSWGPHPEAPAGGGRTALHVACQRDRDHSNASEVVSLLLAHRASTHLLWSGHSPLSLAIASGNDAAVELLLKAGADPNLPLGRVVGSALCALSNIHYDSTGHPHDRAKLLDMLDKAGADIRMPVLVGDGHKRAYGTAVDYAHYSFNQDQCIAHTSYHALNLRQRAVHGARGLLLGLMAAMLRRAAGRGGGGEHSQPASARDKEKFVYKGGGANVPKGSGPRVTVAMETARPESPVEDHETDIGGAPDPAEGKAAEQSHTRADSREQRTSSCRTPLRSCYQCGRSAFVKLKPCSRCHQVLYCSGSCKLKAWEERHRDECRRPGSKLARETSSPPQRERFKSSRAPRPVKASEKASEKAPEVHIDPTENYSFI